jgi:hypothetical protein
MIKTQFTNGGKLHTEFRAEVPKIVKPSIRKEFMQDGNRFYLSEDNRLFDAEIFDRYWLCTVKRPIMGKFYKGRNNNTLTAIMENQL